MALVMVVVAAGAACLTASSIWLDFCFKFLVRDLHAERVKKEGLIHVANQMLNSK